MATTRRANLTLILDRDSKVPLHEQIYAEVSEGVRTGRLREGERLPSVRQLASDLCVSHTIVERAYLELSTEGYIRSVPRSGFIVEGIDTGFFREEQTWAAEGIDEGILSVIGQGLRGEEQQGTSVPFDFSFMRLRPGSFPVRAWQRACNEVCLGSSDPLERYSYHGVTTALQVEVARHLHQARGIKCDPRQVILEPGSPAAISALLSLLDPEADVVGVEEPGWQVPRQIASSMDFKLASLCSDGGSSDLVRMMDAAHPRISFLTPSHQFPTGTVIPLKERIEILELAARDGAYVVEDDSCFEYRYDMRPIPSLYALDGGEHVIYLGNFSKVLSPSLRIAYLVLPPAMLNRLLGESPSGHPGVSSFDAAVLAQMMAFGDYDNHVTRMVRSNKRCHDLLLKSLDDRFGDRVNISGKQSGMHLFVQVHNGMSTDELIASALAEGAKVYSPSRYWFSRPAQKGTVMVGFSAIGFDEVEAGVDALARAWL